MPDFITSLIDPHCHQNNCSTQYQLSREILFCDNILKICLKNANHSHHSQLCYSSSSTQTN